ncbi:MAG TPA: FAD-dependent oxidoreductase [Verrucomicrobiae bacterium]|nr:FAD-dependent oxidoreductase [Verrucomicrobiae bacterium]
MKVQDGSSFDVLVVGGGSAGIIAAISAARCGLKTGLVEQNGYCGGMTVSSSIHALDGILANHDDKELAVAGVAAELVDRLNQVGAIGADNPPECISVDPEAVKWIADQMLTEARVELFYHTRLVDVEHEDGRVTAAIVHNKSGFWRFKADYFIDATGDGDLCAGARAEWEISRLLQPMTLHFRVQVSNGHKTWKDLENDCAEAVSRAHKEGRVPQFGGPWVIRIRDSEVSLNCTRLYGNGLDVKDLTAAEIAGRNNAWKIWNILREELPEFKDSYIVTSGPTVMVRETRRIMGEYVLTADDIVSGRRFPDVIGLGAWPMDIHPGNGDVGYHPHKEHTPPPYQIPYRCLLPKKLDNVLVTGRCMSSTREAHGSIRVQGTGMMMGQAAGLACSVSRQTGKALKEIPYDRLRSELERTGAILDPDKLLPRPVEWYGYMARA